MCVCIYIYIDTDIDIERERQRDRERERERENKKKMIYPPSPICATRHFQGEGGVYFEPPVAGIYTPPFMYTPRTPRRVL